MILSSLVTVLGQSKHLQAIPCCEHSKKCKNQKPSRFELSFRVNLPPAVNAFFFSFFFSTPASFDVTHSSDDSLSLSVRVYLTKCNCNIFSDGGHSSSEFLSLSLSLSCSLTFDLYEETWTWNIRWDLEQCSRTRHLTLTVPFLV